MKHLFYFRDRCAFLKNLTGAIIFAIILLLSHSYGFADNLGAAYGVPPLTQENINRWGTTHFLKVPRINPKAVMARIMSGEKVLIIDVQSSDRAYQNRHVLGAIRVSKNITNIKVGKVPKDYLVVSYCD